MKQFGILLLLVALVGCGSKPDETKTAEKPKEVVKEVIVVKEAVREAQPETNASEEQAQREVVAVELPQATEVQNKPVKSKKQIMQEQKAELDNLKLAWDDQLKIVMATPRINLSPEVAKLQEARRNFAQQSMDECFKLSHGKVVTAMDKMLDKINTWRNDGDLGALIITLEEEAYKQAVKDYDHLSKQCVFYAN